MRSLHLSLAGLSIIISLGLAVVYTEDPIPSNLAERQRTEDGLAKSEFDELGRLNIF